jgi:hypothetical protein
MTRCSATLAALAALTLASCGEKSEPEFTRPLPAASGTTTTSSTATTRAGTNRQPAHPSGPPAAATVRAYFQAIDAEDGAAVCDLLEHGALAAMPLARTDGGCAASLEHSFGAHSSQGPPPFTHVKLRRLRLTRDGAQAKAIARVVTSYAAGRPSIEDDLVYLVRAGSGWAVAQASAILYRAVGLEPPIAALRAPAGF